tara:strand:+ start:1398 stop:3335 length:1938 start_codon:yes stop_codon:yes gene_type:complete
MERKLLTEAQARNLIREIIVWDEMYEAGYLNEAGLWQKIKYKLGKLGSLEKGGKILGRGKASEEASAELQAIMDKAENATLKGFFDRLKEEHPEYPNQESQEDFIRAQQEIGAFFASLHFAAAKKEGEEGYLPCQIANAIIDDLRKVVQKTLDYDLSDVYKHLTEQEKEELNELFGRPSREERWAAIAAGEDDPAEKKASPRLTGKDSSTIKGLKSNLLPALLALGGAAAGMGHILVNQPWFLELVTKKGANPKVITQTLSKVLNVKPGEGPTQMLGRLLQANPGHYGADVPVATMLQDMQAAGIGPEAMAKLGRNPASWLKNWNQMMASPEAGSQTLGQFFGPDAIKGLAWDPTAAGAGVDIGKTVVKTMAQGGGSAAAAGAATAAAASWATGVLGIGLLASAAAVKAIRIKGLKSSRAQALNDLMNTLNPVDCKEGPGEDPPPPDFDGPYEIKVNDIVEKMFREFASENNVEIDEAALETLLIRLEDEWVPGQAIKGADYFDLDTSKDYAGLSEGNISRNPEDKLAQRVAGTTQKPRRRYKSKKGNLINVGASQGRGARHRSLNWHLKRAMLSAQSEPIFKPDVSDKQKKQLIRKIVKAMKADLTQQGAQVSQQQQQQQQEAQQLSESRSLDRWKVLAGIKSE